MTVEILQRAYKGQRAASLPLTSHDRNHFEQQRAIDRPGTADIDRHAERHQKRKRNPPGMPDWITLSLLVPLGVTVYVGCSCAINRALLLEVVWIVRGKGERSCALPFVGS